MYRNKKGTSTLFLAIILSVLILVETTYLAYVAELDRRLCYTRALKEQTEVYLASYDRELFKAYGIYAFARAELDTSVFDSILEANGYETGDTMYVSGMYEFGTEDLRRAVASFYAYRTTGVLLQRFMSQIIALIECIDEYGIIGNLRQFVSSPASGALGRILDGGADIAGYISSALEFLGLDESSPGVIMFNSLLSGLGALSHDAPEIGNGFDPTDMGFVFDMLGFQKNLYDTGTDFNDTFNFHACLTDYAANNFDTILEDDLTINGASFSVFHNDNISDTEYILTGIEGFGGRALTYYYIYGFLAIKNLVSNILDPTIRESVEIAGEILSTVITAVSLGTVPLPAQVYEALILIIKSEIEGVRDLWTVIHGGEITLFEIGEIGAVSMDYRDFLTLFMNYVPDGLILQRIMNIFGRDFPDYVIGIETEVQYRGRILSYDRKYEFYA